MKKNDVLTVTVRVNVMVGWGTALKMFFMGRYPAAILARAMAEKIRDAK